MADYRSQSPMLSMSELAQLLSPRVESPPQDHTAENAGKRNRWDTQPRIHFEEEEEPPPMQNGPVSESLTRLQNGYLHVISVLDKRIDTLQEELNTARMKLNERNALSTTEATQRIAQLEAANEVLQLELEAARAQQKAWVAEIRGLKVSLETKTVVIKDNNRRILRLEQANRRFEEELKAKKQGKAQEVKAENNAESPRKKRRMSITS